MSDTVQAVDGAVSRIVTHYHARSGVTGYESETTRPTEIIQLLIRRSKIVLMVITDQRPQFVSYLRVSTTRQGVSGLGLEAQRAAVAQHAALTGGATSVEFIEVESGTKRSRPVLGQAIAECRKRKATLLIAKLDRLARNVAFVSSLMEGGVEFVAVDAPFANKLMIHILAAFAEHEREQISDRTKRALAAAKARGVVLGRNGRQLAEAHKVSARMWAETLRDPASQAVAGGAHTLEAVAATLNIAGWKTREGAHWAPTTTSRLLRRLNIDLKDYKSTK